MEQNRTRILALVEEFKGKIHSLLDPADEHDALASFESDKEFLIWALDQFLDGKEDACQPAKSPSSI